MTNKQITIRKDMTKKEAIEIYNKLELVKDLKGVKLAYAVAKNKRKIEGELKDLRKATEPTEAFITYDNERLELCKEHAKKTESGRPITEKDFYIMKDWDAYQEDLEGLKSKHADAMKEREEQLDEYDKLLEEPFEIDFHKVKMEELPKDISGEQMDALWPILEDLE